MFEGLNLSYSFFVLFYGLALGAVATTFWNRLPHRISIGPGHYPKCNRCKKEIKFPYFLPIIGYVICQGKCPNKHCNMKIPLHYLFIETSIPILTFILSLKYLFYTEEFLIGTIFSAYLLLAEMMVIKNKKMNIHFVWFGICASFIFGFYIYTMELDDLLMHVFLRLITLLYLDKKGKYFRNMSPLFVVLTVTLKPKYDLIFIISIILLKLFLKLLKSFKFIGRYYTAKIMRSYLFLYHYVIIFF